jgi:nucleoside phosphorylase
MPRPQRSRKRRHQVHASRIRGRLQYLPPLHKPPSAQRVGFKVKSNRRTSSEYTVGWICVLEVEQIAGSEMLDEEHERLPQSPIDHNIYTLGSIGGHNVVIAGLHAPGNNSASVVVTQMRNMFQNLRFYLLVGIGGGVPTKTNNGIIRLGDVVVSKPVGEHSGVVQYDHGKAETGYFRRTGALAPPPAVLLNAAQYLAVQRARTRKDPIFENIKRINTGIRGLQMYKYPGSAQDHLYRPDYIHLDPKVSCYECGCDTAQRLQQAINNEDDDDPYVIIHRGTIASGELVIKDGKLRDKLAKQYGILCFETEAAGALADFPCIVIRGISDYCDSHNNDSWHGYAAAAAAAYARQLFFHMPPEPCVNPTDKSFARGSDGSL